MPLHPGLRLGPYEIIAPLGAGGMGEVWRARDSRLGRDVAIKALPAGFERDAERVARFEREAKALAALLHPNIGAIFGLEEADGARFLLLELIEGETLRARLARGPLPVDEALEVCAQIAAAVEAAHEAGIVHRDLKPGNVMLRPDGTVKVLDFGLAKAAAADSRASGAALENSPTVTSPATVAGVVLGTAAYMSPEQARGKSVDRRADIWAFGCVLFECLSGRQTFEGETVSDLVARILEREPDWEALPPSTPPAVVRLLRRCLTKDARMRLRDIGEARIALGEARAPSAASGPVAAAGAALGTPEAYSPRRTAARMSMLATVALVALVAGAMGGAWMGRARDAAMRPVTRVSILPPGGSEGFGTLGMYALSLNGRRLAFALSDSSNTPHLYVRDLADDQARPLPGTQGAYWPFWSPDSRDLGFFAQGYLCRVPADGGAVRRICPAPEGRGGSWGSRGTIVFSPDPASGIWVVNAAGGTPRQVTRPDSTKRESSHRWPAFLPDGRHFLFAVSGAVSAVNAPIEVAATDDPTRHPLGASVTAATFAAPDRIVFTHDQALLSQRLDARRWKLLGEPTLLRDQPGTNGPIQLLPRVSCSATGVMAFTPDDTRPCDLVEPGPGGERRVIARFPTYVFGPSLSPEGNRVAVSSGGAQGFANSVLDLTTGVVSQIAETGHGLYDVAWSPDGRRLVGTTMAGLRQIDVTTGAESSFVSVGPGWSTIVGWTPDGRDLLLSQLVSGDGYDIMRLPLDPPGPPRAWLATPANERSCALSHDGRLLVYTSDALGPPALFVDTYPTRTGAARGMQVGNWGSTFLQAPIWSPDDREIYSVDTDNHLVAVPVSRGAHPGFGTPRRLATLPKEATGCLLTAEGRYLFLVPHGEIQPSITLVDGWMREAARAR